MKNFDISINLSQFERELINEVSKSEKLGLDWAKKDSIYKQLDDFKKNILAKNTPNEGTEGHKERIALVSEEYERHLYGLSAAREDAEIANVRYKASLAKLDALRTIMSNHREMVKRGL